MDRKPLVSDLRCARITYRPNNAAPRKRNWRNRRGPSIPTNYQRKSQTRLRGSKPGEDGGIGLAVRGEVVEKAVSRYKLPSSRCRINGRLPGLRHPR